jgi:hypothetical protein
VAGKYSTQRFDEIIVTLDADVQKEWKVRFDEPTEDGILVTAEASEKREPLGTVVYRSFKGDRSISFTDGEHSMVFEAPPPTRGRRQLTLKSPSGMQKLIINPDGTFDTSGITESRKDIPTLRLELLVKSVLELSAPLADLIVVQQQSGGGKTKDQCNAAFNSTMKEIAGDAIKDAATGAAGCIAGIFGCLAGLGYVIGAIISTSSKEDQAQEQLKECLADAPA